MSILRKIRTTPIISNVFNFLTKGTSETQDAFDMYNLAVLYKCKDYHVTEHIQNNQSNNNNTNINNNDYQFQFQYNTKISNEKVQDLELKLKNNNYFDDLDYVHQSTTKQVTCSTIYNIL